MKNLKSVFFSLLVLSLSINSAFAGKADKDIGDESCNDALLNALTPGEALILQSAIKFASYGSLPKSKDAIAKLTMLAGSGPSLSDAEGGATGKKADFRNLFGEILKGIDGLTIEDWQSIEGLKFEGKLFLGTREFLDAIETYEIEPGKFLSKDQKRVLKKLNSATDSVRQELKAKLFLAEEKSIKEKKRYLSEQELNELLRQFARDPKFSLKTLGYGTVSKWRYDVITENTALRKHLEKALIDSLKDYVGARQEIPETDLEIMTVVASGIGATAEDIKTFFGTDSIFVSVSEFIERAREKAPSTFAAAVDKRVFTKARAEAMKKAIRKANDIIVFRLGENQDLKNFEEVERLAAGMGNAPIIVAPAFSEVGLIPTTLSWLFERPNVHVMVSKGIQISKDMYIINNGATDKNINPLLGIEDMFLPTDRVLVTHTRVRAFTTATGTYDIQPGYRMTTGTMSEAAYKSKYAQQLGMDDRAQAEHEKNRGLVVLSRRYTNKHFSDLVGGANGIAPRRVQFTPAYYGNPEGLFDMGKIYAKDSVVDLKVIPALVLGDIHLGNTDPQFMNATQELLKSLGILVKNPKAQEPFQFEYIEGQTKLGAVVLHDLADGGPNNGHIRDMLLTLAKMDQGGALDLESHFKSAAGTLMQMVNMLPNTTFVVPVDNHGSDWLVKKLQEGNFMRNPSPKDLPLVLRLMREAIENKVNVYERIFQYFGVDTRRVKFVSADETFRIGIDLENPNPKSIQNGVEIGQHSHMGKNGAKSINLKALLSAYGANVTGHTHSTAEFGQSKKVGTATPVRQDYHRGPSSSDASLAIVYSPEAIQVLRLENGSFLPNMLEEQPAEEFFPGSEWPILLERTAPPEGRHTTDQLRSNPPRERTRIR